MVILTEDYIHSFISIYATGRERETTTNTGHFEVKRFRFDVYYLSYSHLFALVHKLKVKKEDESREEYNFALFTVMVDEK